MTRGVPPAVTRAMPAACPSRKRSGMIRVSGCPLISSKACPNIASARGFQSKTLPLLSIAITASFAASRSAAAWALDCARSRKSSFRSVTSRTMPVKNVSPSASQRPSESSTGNSRPSR